MIRCNEEGIILPPKILSEGDSVNISNGTFSSFVATIETVSKE